MKYGPVPGEEFDTGLDGTEVTGRGLFIVCEGNFMYGNASLSYYDPETGRIENEVYARANGVPLGDVAQSMTLHNGTCWLVVNNSGVVYALEPNTFRERGRITGLTSPRHIHFVSDEKAYITQIWDSRIFIVNPATRSVTGYIETGMDPASGSTEQMVQYGKYLFINCWSNQNRILVVDTDKDEVCNEIEVGVQPSSMVLDANDKLWVLTDGGYEGAPSGHETPSLCRIDAASQIIEKRFSFREGSTPLDLQLDGPGQNLYFINGSVWRMSIDAGSLPAEPFLDSENTLYYSLTVNPVDGDVYVADAVDYVQPGRMYRYSSYGKLIDSFTVGIIPGAFCWL